MPSFKTIRAFIADRPTRQVKALFLSDIMINLATAMVAIFEPIYLYSKGFSLVQIIYFFLCVYVAYLFLMPLGAKFARRFGYEKSIFLSTPFLIAYYLFLFLIPQGREFYFLAAGVLALQKTFYWPSYHADFARFGRARERGREVGNLLIINSLVYIVGPFLGGLLINFYSFEILFVVVGILIVASNLPLLATPEKFTPVPFSYAHAYKRLFYKENRRNFFGFLGFGEEFIALVIWPIFIYTIVSNFFSIGSLVAMATFMTTLVLLYVGRMTDGDAPHRHFVLKIGSVFSAIAWWLRLLVVGQIGVFLVDTFSRLTKDVVVVPMMAMTYERASQTSVMKTVVFFEMSLVAGKIVMMLIALLLLKFMPNSFMALFILAGAMSLLYSLVKYETIKLGNK